MLRRRGAGQQRHIDVQLRHPFAELGVVLLGQHLGGRHKRPLQPRIDGGQEGSDRHHRLAAAHIPLHQPGHGLGLAHIGEQLAQHPLLSAGQLKRQQGTKSLEPFTHGRSRQCWCLTLAVLQPPLGQVQLQQQKLVKHQPPAACIEMLPVAGLMNSAASIGLGHQLELLAQGFWQGIWPWTNRC